jgi:hypothetical protein
MRDDRTPEVRPDTPPERPPAAPSARSQGAEPTTRTLSPWWSLLLLPAAMLVVVWIHFGPVPAPRATKPAAAPAIEPSSNSAVPGGSGGQAGLTTSGLAAGAAGPPGSGESRVIVSDWTS